MTAPDLTAIVESVAREKWRMFPMTDESWDELPEDLKAIRRASARVVVRATLTAIMPLADGWDSIADEFHDKATAAYQEGGRDIAGAAWRAIADTNRRHAEELRGVMGS